MKYLAEVRLNEIVLRRLAHHLQRLDLIQIYAKEASARGGKDSDMAVIEKRIHDEEARRKNLVKAISGNVVRLDEAGEELQEIRNNLETLNQSRSKLLVTNNPLAPAELQTL